MEVKKLLVLSDFGVVDTPLIENEFTKIGSRTLLAGEFFVPGFGRSPYQDSATGRLFAKLQKAGPAALNGVLKLEIRDANDDFLTKVFEEDSSVLSQGETDVTKRVPFPVRVTREKKKKFVSKDMRLVLLFKNRAAAETLVAALSSLAIDMTQVTR